MATLLLWLTAPIAGILAVLGGHALFAAMTDPSVESQVYWVVLFGAVAMVAAAGWGLMAVRIGRAHMRFRPAKDTYETGHYSPTPFFFHFQGCSALFLLGAGSALWLLTRDWS
ncbi:MAG: hypothetical protein WC068_04920 [Caulobacter sp.]